MSQLEKLMNSIKNNPKTVKFEELDKILLRAGFTKSQPRGGSSHYTYKKDGKRLTVPYKQPYIKSEYIKQAIEILDDFFEKN